MSCNLIRLPNLTPPQTGTSYCSNCGDTQGNRARKTNFSSFGRLSSLPRVLASDSNNKEIASEPLTSSSESQPNPSKCCRNCNFIIRPETINYAAVLENLVWLYICKDVSVRLPQDENADTQMQKVLRILPIVRSYKSVSEIGINMYKNECYFVTHIIYVFCDWGRHAVNRQLFAEEFVFIVENMSVVIELDDPELVGEFVHCLRILQVDKKMESVVEFAYYLILFSSPFQS